MVMQIGRIKEARLGGGQRAHTLPRRGLGWARAWWGCGHPGSPLRLSSGLHVLLGEILTLDFVPSNSENIFLLAFLKQKPAENKQLALRHLVNRLVLENV